jgi:rare lipoprotein A
MLLKLFISGLLIILTACNTTKPELSTPAPRPAVVLIDAPVKVVEVVEVVEVIGFKQQTYASWYQAQEHGAITASGEVYDYYGITAAHKNLPFGSLVRVHYPRNGNAITVKINDRVSTEDIKLSAYAAEILGITRDIRPLVNIDGVRR